jgi:hypothetical protein
MARPDRLVQRRGEAVFANGVDSGRMTASCCRSPGATGHFAGAPPERLVLDGLDRERCRGQGLISPTLLVRWLGRDCRFYERGFGRLADVHTPVVPDASARPTAPETRPQREIPMRNSKQPADYSHGPISRVARAILPATAGRVVPNRWRQHVGARLVASCGAMILATTALLNPQAAAAATTYHVKVVFTDIRFTRIDDSGLTSDPVAEVYGRVSAYTSAGAVSASGLPYRILGTWGDNPSGCSAGGVAWDNGLGSPCVKKTAWDGVVGHWTTKNLEFAWLCPSSTGTSCAETWSTNNSFIRLDVVPGQTIRIGVYMKDYDWGSSDDVVCNGSKTFGPFTDAELQALSIADHIHMLDNGNAECFANFEIF